MHLSFSVGQFLLSEEHFSCAVGTRRKYFCIYSDCASSFTRTVSVGTSSYDRWPFENMRRSIALPFRTKVLRTFANKASFVRRVVHHRTLRNQKVQEKVVGAVGHTMNSADTAGTGGSTKISATLT